MTWKPEGIVIHCSATRPEWMADAGIDAKRAEIRRWHVEGNGWRDIGYAWLCDLDGSTAHGRDTDGDGDPFNDIGAHTRGWNRKAIGLCLIGGSGSNADDEFSEHFTPEQDMQLRAQIAYLRARFPSIKWVKGHNEFAPKACPGFSVPHWLDTPAKNTGGKAAAGAVAVGGVVAALVAFACKIPFLSALINTCGG